MKKFLLLTMVFISALIIIAGCGSEGSHSGYGKDKELEVIYEVKVNEKGGITTVTHSGIAISTDSETFASNKDITVYITEIKEPSGVNSLFKVASKCYKVSAQTKDKVEITEVFKPVMLSIDNYASPTSDIFIGTKSPDNEDWAYDCVKSNLSSSVRAATSSKIDYELYRLGSTIAVFAADSTAISKIPTITGLTINNLGIPEKGGKFTEDAEMCLTLSGLNLDSAKNTDLQVRLSYEYVNKDMKLAVSGGTVSYKVSDAQQGSGNSFVHNLDIVNITKIDSVANEITLKLTLGLKDKEVLLIPGKFNVEVRSTSKSEKFKTLPFCISSIAELKAKSVTPSPTPTDEVPIPTGVVASYNEETKVVSAKWSWLGTDKDVEYLIKIANTSVSGAGSYNFSGVRDTKWDSAKAGLVLSSGTYELTVSATTASGISKASAVTDKSKFTVKNVSPPPTPTDEIPVPTDVVASYNEETKVVSANWSWSGTDKDVEYLIKIANTSVSGTGSHNFSGVKDTKWDSSKSGLVLASGSYEITVSATTASGTSKASAVTDKSKFTVKNAAPAPTPTDEVPIPTDVVASYNEETKIVSANWAWSGTDKEVEYLIKIANTSVSGAGSYNFSGIRDTKWDSAKAGLVLSSGNYEITVSATTASGISKASTVTDKSKFTVTIPAWRGSLTAPVINIAQSEYDYNSNVTITWEPSQYKSIDGNTGEIKYTVYADLAKQPETVIAAYISETQCVLANAKAGTYLVKVVATANGLTATSETVSFNVKQPVVGKPVITTPQYVLLNSDIDILWEAADNAISYNIYIYTGSVLPDLPSVSNITSTSYKAKSIITDAGVYNVVVEAVNGEVKTLSEPKEMFVNLAPVESADITITDAYAGNKATVTWTAGNEAPGVTYYVNILQSNNVIASYQTTLLKWNEQYLAAGAYKVEISAKNLWGQSASATAVLAVINNTIRVNIATESLSLKPIAEVVLDYPVSDEVKTYISDKVCIASESNVVETTKEWLSNVASPTLQVKPVDRLVNKSNYSFGMKSDALSEFNTEYCLAFPNEQEFYCDIGNGTPESPYLVYCAESLYDVRNNLNAYYKQICDIDLTSYSSDAGWLPIGNIANEFNGHFDGGEFVITGLKINRPESNYIGLFGAISNDAKVTNCRIVDAVTSGSRFVSVLVGYNRGTISNSYVSSSTVSGNNYYVGGMAGDNSGTISNSYVSSSTVSGSDLVGGMAGYNFNGTISNSYVSSSTVSGSDTVGGLAGDNSGTIRNSYVSSSTVSGNNYVGGMAGDNFGTISNSYVSSSTVSGNNNYVGGMAGDIGDGTISNSFACGYMKVNDSDPGALVGDNDGGSGRATNCYYWANGYKQDDGTIDWTGKWTDWSPDIWDIPTSGGFTQATPCLPKLKCFE